MNNPKDTMNYSPEKRKINYYEQNPKLFKKKRLRPSLNENPNINGSNTQINFNMEYNDGILNMLNNNISVSQPMNQSNINNSNDYKFNILDDFLDELEKENNGMNCFISQEKPMGSELKELFTRNKYNAYFQTSRTQNPQFNAWEDFHHKRDKL